jgi:hypothetical protein
MSMPKPRHGRICTKTALIVGGFVEEHDLGQVFSNDTGVVSRIP